jgi:urea transport system permease protein
MQPWRLILPSATRVLALAAALVLGAPAGQAAEDLRALVQALAAGEFDDKVAAIQALGAAGDPAAAPVLEALGEGDLYVREADGQVVFAVRDGREFKLTDPLTGAELGTAGRREVDKIRVNNSVRRAVAAALGGLTLRSPDPAVRRAAAAAIFKSRAPDQLEGLENAIAAEQDAGIKAAMAQAAAAIRLTASADQAERLAALELVAARGDGEALSLLRSLAGDPDGEVAAAADAAIAGIEQQMALWNAAQNVYYGLSLGSVLLLAAIGLAITFGVMGVINMAHGEMVMLGAYTTFVVQGLIRSQAPWLFDASLLIAIPLAFLISGGIGILIERGIIRFLYGRPLETLLATWGLSLILQQAVRSLFGPTNQAVGNPSWMSGATQLGGLTLTYNRIWILVFSLLVLALLMAALKRTSFGLQMRAVTQNRQMASAMGIRTPWVDALTFGLGSGVAGIAGVALSQIDNVSPNLGQGYIIDSFMVVVFGGVGNLWGTLVGAMTLGVANKFLEPYAGAVLGKILVLVFIILFIQKRPRGLFALKGRAVEA